tara:strand:- start:705 stop:1100 length:396 start_codon:yes stop_codon:yes gene_type:complete
VKIKTRKLNNNKDDNLLPLVNIIFLLLIFFMMVGIIERKKDLYDINLATVELEQYKEQNKNILFIKKDGSLIIDNDLIISENLQTTLESKNIKGDIIIAADSTLTSLELNKVLTKLHRSKIDQITLITLKK